MAAPMSFRSAFNGFNREDVVHYIEYLNTRHTDEVNQLNTELEQLRNQANLSDEMTELQEQLADALERNEQLQAQIAQLEERCNERMARPEPPATDLEARCLELERQLQEARTLSTASSQYHLIQEVEAYRRAERAEREAKERAEVVYRQANGALADATVKVDETFHQISDLTDKVTLQLQQLQQAVTNSRQALSDASAFLYHIAPGSEN